jgi:hypothetical protein
MNKTPEDEEFERVERESGWRKRQIMAEDDDDIQDYKKFWVGLTSEDIARLGIHTTDMYPEDFIRYIESILREKNT